MKKLLYLTLLIPFLSFNAKSQTLFVQNNSGCSVSVTLLAYDAGAPSGCGCSVIPTKTYAILPSNSVTFNASDLLSTP